VTRLHLQQPLPGRVVVAAGQRAVQAGARRRVLAPGQPVGDDQAGQLPLGQLLVQLARCRRVLAAVGRKLRAGHAARAVGHVHHLRRQPQEVAPAAQQVAPQTFEDARGSHASRPLHGAVGQRRDGASGDLVVAQTGDDHVAVAVVGVGIGAGLGPLPADEGHQVRVLRITGLGVALAHAVDGLAPARRREALGVIVQREEVQVRAEAREVAGVGGRMGALAPEHGKRVHQGVDGERGVDVEIAEQDAPLARRSQGLGCPGAVGLGAGHPLCVAWRGGHAAGRAVRARQQEQQRRCQRQQQHEADQGALHRAPTLARIRMMRARPESDPGRSPGPRLSRRRGQPGAGASR
jgi:hypothetical protein